MSSIPVCSGGGLSHIHLWPPGRLMSCVCAPSYLATSRHRGACRLHHSRLASVCRCLVSNASDLTRPAIMHRRGPIRYSSFHTRTGRRRPEWCLQGVLYSSSQTGFILLLPSRPDSASSGPRARHPAFHPSFSSYVRGLILWDGPRVRESVTGSRAHRPSVVKGWLFSNEPPRKLHVAPPPFSLENRQVWPQMFL